MLNIRTVSLLVVCFLLLLKSSKGIYEPNAQGGVKTNVYSRDPRVGHSVQRQYDSSAAGSEQLYPQYHHTDEHNRGTATAQHGRDIPIYQRPQRQPDRQESRYNEQRQYSEDTQYDAENFVNQYFTECPTGATGQFAYLLNCRQFINCWKGRGHVQNCAPGTAFNPQTLECDNPSKVNCHGVGSSTRQPRHNVARLEHQSSYPSGTTTSEGEVKCKPGESGVFPHPYDCKKFLNCANGRTFIQSCGPGTGFNPRMGVCDHLWKLDCASETSNTDLTEEYDQNRDYSNTQTTWQHTGGVRQPHYDQSVSGTHHTNVQTNHNQQPQPDQQQYPQQGYHDVNRQRYPYPVETVSDHQRQERLYPSTQRPNVYYPQTGHNYDSSQRQERLQPGSFNVNSNDTNRTPVYVQRVQIVRNRTSTQDGKITYDTQFRQNPSFTGDSELSSTDDSPQQILPPFSSPSDTDGSTISFTGAGHSNVNPSSGDTANMWYAQPVDDSSESVQTRERLYPTIQNARVIPIFVQTVEDGNKPFRTQHTPSAPAFDSVGSPTDYLPQQILPPFYSPNNANANPSIETGTGTIVFAEPVNNTREFNDDNVGAGSNFPYYSPPKQPTSDTVNPSVVPSESNLFGGLLPPHQEPFPSRDQSRSYPDLYPVFQNTTGNVRTFPYYSGQNQSARDTVNPSVVPSESNLFGGLLPPHQEPFRSSDLSRSHRDLYPVTQSTTGNVRTFPLYPQDNHSHTRLPPLNTNKRDQTISYSPSYSGVSHSKDPIENRFLPRPNEERWSWQFTTEVPVEATTIPEELPDAAALESFMSTSMIKSVQMQTPRPYNRKYYEQNKTFTESNVTEGDEMAISDVLKTLLKPHLDQNKERKPESGNVMKIPRKNSNKDTERDDTQISSRNNLDEVDAESPLLSQYMATSMASTAPMQTPQPYNHNYYEQAKNAPPEQDIEQDHEKAISEALKLLLRPHMTKTGKSTSAEVEKANENIMKTLKANVETTSHPLQDAEIIYTGEQESLNEHSNKNVTTEVEVDGQGISTRGFFHPSDDHPRGYHNRGPMVHTKEFHQAHPHIPRPNGHHPKSDVEILPSHQTPIQQEPFHHHGYPHHPGSHSIPFHHSHPHPVRPQVNLPRGHSKEFHDKHPLMPNPFMPHHTHPHHHPNHGFPGGHSKAYHDKHPHVPNPFGPKPNPVVSPPPHHHGFHHHHGHFPRGHSREYHENNPHIYNPFATFDSPTSPKPVLIRTVATTVLPPDTNTETKTETVFLIDPRIDTQTELSPRIELLTTTPRTSNEPSVDRGRGIETFEQDHHFTANFCEFNCGNGKCVKSSEICDGANDCGNRLDEASCDHIGFQIRLSGAEGHSNMGRLEVKAYGKWGYVCDDKFGMRDANVACKELGFALGASEVRANSYYSPHVAMRDESNNVLFMMDELECTGNETSLRECNFKGWGVHDCAADEVVGIVCKVPVMKCPNDYWMCSTTQVCIPPAFVCDNVPDCPDKSDESPAICNATIDYRLVGGSTSLEGRVEVKYRGIWGTVCDDDFGETEAQIVCNSLGYYGKSTALKNAYGPGSGPIWLDQVSCDGSETSLDKCSHFSWGEHNCNHTEDTSIRCTVGSPSSAHRYDSSDQQVQTNLEPNYWNEHDVYLYQVERSSKHLPLTSQLCGQISRNLANDSQQNQFMARVISGKNARRGHHPWQATIRAKGRAGKSTHWCGAALISKWHLLTAAHCLVGFPKGAYLVRLGDHHADITETSEIEVFIENWYIHEEFRKGQHMNNDIAVVVLKNPVQFSDYIWPICLPGKNTNYETGRRCTISGWGSIQSGVSTPSNILRAAQIPILSPDICKRPYVYGDAITEGMFCAGTLDEGADACDGDSGGPFACTDGDQETLYGIISWGQHCGYVNKPGVYVNVTYYLDWISEQMSKFSPPRSG